MEACEHSKTVVASRSEPEVEIAKIGHISIHGDSVLGKGGMAQPGPPGEARRFGENIRVHRERLHQLAYAPRAGAAIVVQGPPVGKCGRGRGGSYQPDTRASKDPESRSSTGNVANPNRTPSTGRSLRGIPLPRVVAPSDGDRRRGRITRRGPARREAASSGARRWRSGLRRGGRRPCQRIIPWAEAGKLDDLEGWHHRKLLEELRGTVPSGV